MGSMIIFCVLFFCSSMALSTAPHKIAKYNQLFKTIKQLEPTVKDKDVELLHTPENPVTANNFDFSFKNDHYAKVSEKRPEFNAIYSGLKTPLQRTTRRKDKNSPISHEDGCLFTAVTCFKKGILKLQPKNSQVNATFSHSVEVLKRFTFRNPGKHCEYSCESYEKKNPKEFLKSFAKLIQQLFKN